MSKSKIEWVTNSDGTQGQSWNPLKVKTGWFGCTKVSAGCNFCYASRMVKRFGGIEYDYHRKPTDFYLDEKVLEQPLHWRKPRTVFVGSMTDIFHENVDGELIFEVLRIMRTCQQRHAHRDCYGHTFLLLTKRPERMAPIIRQARSVWRSDFPNVWLGTTVENADYIHRIDILRNIPAARRFLSLEPLLGPLPNLDLTGIDWVIVGGESGPGARPMHPNWVRSLRDQCVAAGVPFFFKQWGEFAETGPMTAKQLAVCHECGWSGGYDTESLNGHWLSHRHKDWQIMYRVGKKAAGRILDCIEWNQRPEKSA